MYQNFIIPYLHEAQHVSGNTPPIIRSLKLHWQPLVFRMWRVVGRVVGGHCQRPETTRPTLLQGFYRMSKHLDRLWGQLRLLFVENGGILQRVKRQ